MLFVMIFLRQGRMISAVLGILRGRAHDAASNKRASVSPEHVLMMDFLADILENGPF